MAAVRLTSTDLRLLADKLEALEDADVDVTELRVGETVVHVESTTDQREGLTYYVIGVSGRSSGPGHTWQGHPPGCRSA